MDNLCPALIEYINSCKSAPNAQTKPVVNQTAKINLGQSSDVFVNSANTAENIKKAKAKKVLKAVAIGVSAAALITSGIIIAKSISARHIKQLAENIEFKNANTIEEAIKFGKENLGIKKYKGFTSSDLDILNWINEGLVDVNNVNGGKAAMPRVVSYVESIHNHQAAGSMNCVGHLQISREILAKKVMSKISDSFKSDANVQKIFEQIGSSGDYSGIKDIMAKKIPLEYKPTIDFLNKICVKDTVYHEMGHLQHFCNSPSLFGNLGNEKQVIKLFLTPKAKNLRKLFETKIDVAKDVSDYAATSPCEFVAECYEKLVKEKLFNEKLLSDEALELYQKFGGAMIV